MKELRVSKQGKHVSKITLQLIRKYHSDTGFKEWVDHYVSAHVKIPQLMLSVLLLANQIRNKPEVRKQMEEEKCLNGNQEG